jgi:hypothetical protein
MNTKYYVIGLKKQQISEINAVEKMMDIGFSKFNTVESPVILTIGGKQTDIHVGVGYERSEIDINDDGLGCGGHAVFEALGNQRYHATRYISMFGYEKYKDLYDEKMYGLTIDKDTSVIKLDYSIVTVNYSTQYKRELVLSIAIALGKLLTFQTLNIDNEPCLLSDETPEQELRVLQVLLESFWAVKVLKEAGYEGKIPYIYSYNDCTMDVIPALLTGTLITSKSEFINQWSYKFSDFMGTRIADGKPLSIEELEEKDRLFSKKFEKQVVTATKRANNIIGLANPGEPVKGLVSAMSSTINKKAINTIKKYQDTLIDICNQVETTRNIKNETYLQYKQMFKDIVDLVGAKYKGSSECGSLTKLSKNTHDIGMKDMANFLNTLNKLENGK